MMVRSGCSRICREDMQGNELDGPGGLNVDPGNRNLAGGGHERGPMAPLKLTVTQSRARGTGGFPMPTAFGSSSAGSTASSGTGDGGGGGPMFAPVNPLEPPMGPPALPRRPFLKQGSGKGMSLGITVTAAGSNDSGPDSEVSYGSSEDAGTPKDVRGVGIGMGAGFAGIPEGDNAPRSQGGSSGVTVTTGGYGDGAPHAKVQRSFTPLKGRLGSSFVGGGRSLVDGNARPVEETARHDLKPVESPEATLRQVATGLATANKAGHLEQDWMAHFEAIDLLRRLVEHHMSTVLPQAMELFTAVLPAVDNLRSYLAKNAIVAIHEAYGKLGKAMDATVDATVLVLMKKYGENNTFLHGQVGLALSAMVQNVTDIRAMTALLACGGHKSPAVRMHAAFHLEQVVQKMAQDGAGQSLSTKQRDVLERCLMQAIVFLDEGSSETRCLGKRIICAIVGLPFPKGDVERVLRRLPSEAKSKQVRAVIDDPAGAPPLPGKLLASTFLGSASRGSTPASPKGSLLNRPPSFGKSASTPSNLGQGLGVLDRIDSGDMSSSMASAAGRYGGADYYSASEAAPPPSPMAAKGRAAGVRGPPPKRQASKLGQGANGGAGGGGGCVNSPTSAEVLESLKDALAKMTSGQWKDRLDALSSVSDLVRANPDAVASRVMVLTDPLLARLADGNSKVTVAALNALSEVLLPGLRDAWGCVANTLVPALGSAMSSSNAAICAAGKEAMASLLDHVEDCVLLASVAQCATHAGARVRPLMMAQLTEMLGGVHTKKPALVVKHAVPVLLEALKEPKGEIKTACSRLLDELCRLMGDSLLEHVAEKPEAIQRRVREALGMN
eukprot:jgi/Mesvir1/1594/Mv14562-RA.1